MRKATRAQWVKFGIVTLLYLMFLVWVKSWWGLIVLPFIFDVYISKKIPWSFWKKSKNPAVRGIMSWVDAIVFALVAVYFVNIYIFQNYQIPSSSLEKSLLVGDFLYVSKMSYGPRVPNTPLSMPLAQHTLPIFNTKSYIEWPQWVKFGIVTLLYLMFLVWVKSWWGLIVLPFIFDVYISKKIPWSFWKKSKNPAVRGIMSWVDAIVFALVAVYFVNIYIFQNYQIPSSSLEKSLLVGDFLYVSKMSYGPRVPNTPLSMPLAQHTLPIFNTKSYIEWPQWKYKRVPGFGKVKLNDIVVFNFPAGDTVALNRQQEDFYSLAYREGQRVYPNKINMDSLTRDQQRTVYDLYYNAGRNLIRTNPQMYGDIVVRPVDRRENYVKRCVGLPGDTLQIKDTQVYIDGKAIENPEEMQLNYFVQTTGPYIPEEMFRELGISNDDQILMTDDFNYEEGLMQMGLDRRDAQGRLTPVYHLPLTQKMYDTLAGNKKLVSRIVMEPENLSGQMYPQNLYTKWTRDNYGPVWIPEKGATITLNKDNLPIYERCIVAYEGNTLEQKPDGIYINGQKTDTYTFKLDYYWMMGDNRHNSLDSRYWGFVPEDHVVGKPIVVWLSLDKDRGWFDGKIRWNRIFKWVH